MTKTLTLLAGAALMLGGVGMVVDDLSNGQVTPPAVAIDPAPALSGPVAESAEKPSVKSARTPRAHPRAPTEVQVPYLGIAVPVVPVPLGSDGSLTPPSDPQVLGRWSGGALADDKHGAMLLTGHTVHTGGGALDDLETVPEGALVVVATGRGAVEYRVASTEIRTKAWVAGHAQGLFGQTGRHRLVLVTCEGYDASTGEYDSNVVVIGYPTR